MKQKLLEPKIKFDTSLEDLNLDEYPEIEFTTVPVKEFKPEKSESKQLF